MILLLLYALFVESAYNAKTPVSKPYRVRYEIRWQSPLLKPTTHERRFRRADDAITFQSRARLCTYNPAPCVIWATAEPVPIPPYATVRFD